MKTDINYLLHRQQMSLLRAQTARCIESRTIYEELARQYGARVSAYAEENRRIAYPTQ